MHRACNTIHFVDGRQTSIECRQTCSSAVRSALLLFTVFTTDIVWLPPSKIARSSARHIRRHAPERCKNISSTNLRLSDEDEKTGNKQEMFVTPRNATKRRIPHPLPLNRNANYLYNALLSRSGLFYCHFCAIVLLTSAPSSYSRQYYLLVFAIDVAEVL